MTLGTAPEYVDRLHVRVCRDREDLGAVAAAEIGETLARILEQQPSARVVFAAAPSQGETLAALAAGTRVDWTRVDAFHMDEYLGIAPDAPQRFGNWLRAAFFDRVALRSVNLIDPENDPAAEAARYGALVTAAPVDVVLAGIGANGHLAFNDPPADFSEPRPARTIELQLESRKQQVDEGLFETLDEVPERAITLSVPALLSAAHVFCMVPGRLKRGAVERTLHGPVGRDCPASVLRTHPDARLYVDEEASPYA